MALEEADPDIEDDEYDEEADSDFEGQGSDAGSVSSSGGDEPVSKSEKSGKKAVTSKPLIEELDSGDEATIKERKKSKKKQKRTKDVHLSSDEEKDDVWRAKTRSMRAQEQEAKQRKNLVSIKSSTIDVNSIWEELNKPGPLPPVRVEGELEPQLSPRKQDVVKDTPTGMTTEEMITIRRNFKFAGEMHVEEKTVPKSSAEARLWLAQQDNKNNSPDDPPNGKQRPLRKISRFDPNYSNLEAFRNHSIKVQSDAFTGPKLNVVEKSKMDWASHVDAEGLKDELDKHAKTKDAYLTRMDFLSQVEQRKEDEARQARQNG